MVYDVRVSGDAGDAQRAAFEAEVRRINDMDDLATAFREASDLVDRQAAFRGEAASCRARLAQRLWESGDASIARVADRLGITRQRAYQLIKRAREDAARNKDD